MRITTPPFAGSLCVVFACMISMLSERSTATAQSILGDPKLQQLGRVAFTEGPAWHVDVARTDDEAFPIGPDYNDGV